MPSDSEQIADLKKQVAILTRAVEALYARNGEPMPAADVTIDDPPADVVEMLRAGNLINAIKLWRDYTGLGLAEAKAEMEELSGKIS